MDVKVEGQQAAARLLNGALASQLGRLSHHRIIAADEVEALLENETRNQAVGCDDVQCLAELAGALGARLVVTGQLLGAGNRMLWNASVVDQQQGVVTARGSVQGPDLSSVHAQADDLALQLLGRSAELQGEAGARRLGFGDAKTMAEFQAYRSQRPTAPTDEALTDFLVDHNRESPWLAWAQVAAFFAAGACLLPVAPSLVLSIAMGDVGLGLGYPVVAVAALAMLVSLGLGITGLSLVALDAADVGHRRVKRTGCCRRDADLRDRLRPTSTEIALAVTSALVGPVLATLSAAGMVAGFVLIANTGLGTAPSVLDYFAEVAALAMLPVAGCCLLGLGGASAAAGIWLLAMPQRAYLEEEPPAAPAAPATVVAP